MIGNSHRKTPELPAQLSMSSSVPNIVSHFPPQISPKVVKSKSFSVSLVNQRKGTFSKKDSDPNQNKTFFHLQRKPVKKELCLNKNGPNPY